MKIDDFLKLMQKLKRFKIRLEEEGIKGQYQKVVLKVYISDLTSRINVDMLEVI